MAALLPAPPPHDPAASSPVTPIDIDSLVASVSGTVIRPDDEAYDEARHIHNTLIDRRAVADRPRGRTPPTSPGR